MAFLRAQKDHASLQVINKLSHLVAYLTCASYCFDHTNFMAPNPTNSQIPAGSPITVEHVVPSNPDPMHFLVGPHAQGVCFSCVLCSHHDLIHPLLGVSWGERINAQGLGVVVPGREEGLSVPSGDHLCPIILSLGLFPFTLA